MPTLLADMNVSGDLAALLLDYLAANQLQIAELERELKQFQPASRMRFQQWWRLLQGGYESLWQILLPCRYGRLSFSGS